MCGLGVLINVLSFQTYTAPGLNPEDALSQLQVDQWNMWDINGLSEDDRKLYCLTRGQSFELIEWLDWTFTTGFPNMPVWSIFTQMVFNMCQMLCDYKWRADQEQMPCMPWFTVGTLQDQITGVLRLLDEMNPNQVASGFGMEARKWKLPIHHPKAQSIIPLSLDGACFRKSRNGPYERRPQEDLFRFGETTWDKAFAARLEVKREIIGAS